MDTRTRHPRELTGFESPQRPTTMIVPPPPAAPRPRAGRAGAVLYLLLAGAAAGAVLHVNPPSPDVSPPHAFLPGALVLAAVAIERASRRASPVSRTIGPAASVYAAAGLLVPTPWAVIVAALGATLCYLPRRRLHLPTRLAAIAGPLAATTAFTALVGGVVDIAGGGLVHHGRAAIGIGGMPIHAASVVAMPGRLPVAALLDISASGLVALGLLAALVVAYAALDVASTALASAVFYKGDARWSSEGAVIRRPAILAAGAVACLGVMAAVLFAVAPPIALLCALPALALPAADDARRRRDGQIGAGASTGIGALGDGAGISAGTSPRGRIEDIAPDGGAPAAGPVTHLERQYGAGAGADIGAPGRGYLEATLVAVRAIGGDTDLARVTDALATATGRLTPFRACAVYLYEPRDGIFVVHARAGSRAATRDMATRDEVGALMDERHRVGYSYYAPRPAREDTSPGVWLPGDTLLVPLLAKDGDVVGYVELDDPADRHVPGAATLAPLETVASLAANVIARLRHTDEALQLAATDGLTGLLNRRSLEDRLQREYALAERRRRPLALLMIDIDDFGAVNNTHGHQIGDAALRLVSGVIRAHVSGGDAGGRYGGDEFAVLLPGRDAEEAAVVAERLRAALVEATTRAAREGTLPCIHTSIGVAASPSDARDAAALMKAADDALYASKRMGKNCVSRYRAA